MAYVVGQLLKDEETENKYLLDYKQNEDFSIENDSTNYDYLTGYYSFEDIGIVLSNKQFIPSETYYLSFYVERVFLEDDKGKSVSFDIMSRDGNGDYEQYIKTVNVQEGSKENLVFVNLIFTPIVPCDRIVLKLRRTSEDFIPGREKKLSIESITLQKIENILPEQNIEKIGIQGPSGLLFTINGEEMRIGRTGIYELYNKDIPITYLGFVTKKGDNKFFIVDYQYDEKEGND